MTPYWVLLLLPMWACLKAPCKRWTTWQSWLIGIFLTAFIGLRHEIGGDWFSYIGYVTRAKSLVFTELMPWTADSMNWGDPGYNLLNWVFASNWGIYGVNFVSAAIFSTGLVLFCRAQPRPWLALCLSIPYLVIVVSMGYSRQGVALGLIMPGLLALEKGRLLPFFASMVMAATFHSTALVVLIFVIPAVRGSSLGMRAVRLLLFMTLAGVLAQVFLFSEIDRFVSGYVEAEYESEGAAIRIGMNLLPALLLLFWQKRFDFTAQQLNLWRSMAFTAIACTVVLILFPSNSTAVDRISLYIIPLQIVVGCRLPSTRLFGLNPKQLLVVTLGFCISVEFVWLNFASHSPFWLPYSSVVFN